MSTLTFAQVDEIRVSAQVMEQVYEEVKTPFKYGLVLVPPDTSKMMDSPSVSIIT